MLDLWILWEHDCPSLHTQSKAAASVWQKDTISCLLLLWVWFNGTRSASVTSGKPLAWSWNIRFKGCRSKTAATPKLRSRWGKDKKTLNPVGQRRNCESTLRQSDSCGLQRSDSKWKFDSWLSSFYFYFWVFIPNISNRFCWIGQA